MTRDEIDAMEDETATVQYGYFVVFSHSRCRRSFDLEIPDGHAITSIACTGMVEMRVFDDGHAEGFYSGSLEVRMERSDG